MFINKFSTVFFNFFLISCFSQQKDFCNKWQSITDTINDHKLANKINWEFSNKVDEICRTKIFISQGYLYIHQRNIDSSSYYLDKAIFLAKKNKKKELLADAYSKRAYVYAQNNKEKKAIDLLKKTRKILVNKPKSEHWVLYHQAYAYLADIKSDYKTALKHTDSTIAISEAADFKEELPSCYGNQGTYYIRLSKYEKAISSYLKAIKLLEEEKSSEIDIYYNILATAYKRIGQYNLAIKYYGMSLLATKKSQNDFVKMLTYSRMSDAQKKLNLYQEAIISIDSSIVIAEKIKNDNFVIDGLNSKGLIYFDNLKNYDKAETFLKKSYYAKVKTNSTKLMLNMNTFSIIDGMVKINLHRKNHTEAIKFIGLLEKEVQKTNTANFRKILYSRKSNYFENLKKYEKSNKYLKLYYSIKDSTQNKEVQLKVADLEKKYDTKTKELEIAKLNKENVVQEKKIAQSNSNQRILIFSIIGTEIFLLFGFFAYYKIRKQKKQLTVVNKELNEINTVKNQLFSILSHDLRGMIMPFQRVGKIIKHYADKGDVDKTILLSQELENNSQKLSNTLDNLLNWSLQQMNSYSYKNEEIIIKEELSEIIENYSYHAKLKNTKLSLELENDEKIFFDKGAFHVIFRNLISNALKFTENGTIKVVTSKKLNTLHFSVIDSGVGIPEMQLKKLFSVTGNEMFAGTQGEKE
ncbi:tetratricopeptide repeat-containing sensor histidine kinase [Tenacibaculum sp.]|nr:tetratricopeptide repeat-containing sensor histidine kinase [Tenacibaculum sp.]